MDNTKATLFHPQTGKQLAEISLLGDPFKADTLLSASGHLQSYLILSGNGKLQKAWLKQQAVLLHVGNRQQQVRIITYPSDGENQGHLEFIPGSGQYAQVEAHSRLGSRPRRGLAIIQTLLGI